MNCLKLLQEKGYIHFYQRVFIILFGRRKAIIYPHAGRKYAPLKSDGTIKNAKSYIQQAFPGILLKITHISAQYLFHINNLPKNGYLMTKHHLFRLCCQSN